MLEITSSTITSGGSTFIFATLVDEDDNPYTTATTISFTSDCARVDTASIPSVTTSTGEARTTYTANGCTGTDTVTASAVVNSETLTATGDVTIAPIVIGSGEPPSSAFTAGVMDIANTPIASDGTTDIQVSLADASGNLYEGSADIYFTSACIQAGTASVSSSPITTSDGTVTVTYTPDGCLGTDTITAATIVDGSALTVMGDVEVLATSGATIALGNGSGTPPAGFDQGNLDIAISPLSAGSSTAVNATLADSTTGSLYQTATDVTFTAVCTTDGGINNGTIDSPVTTIGGSVSTTYTSGGCNGDVTITASATVDGTPTTATGTVNVLPGTANSIVFISSDPTLIGLRDYGSVVASKVTFRLLDTTGNPLSGQDINFSLNTAVGGIALTSATETTDADGYVSTWVNSGNVATTVRVTATHDTIPTITAVSDSLTISTGIPDQNSFSISASRLNLETLQYNASPTCDPDTEEECSSINILASDHFNNPVPDGTSIYFTTEGGQIEPTCTTSDGGCSVVWKSSSPKPSDGRITILATAVGEESFIDSNGTGTFDDGEYFGDLPEAWRDDDEDGVFDNTGAADDEEARDFDGDTVYDAADGLYNGILCDGPTECDGVSTTTFVRADIVLIMSGSVALIGFDTDGDDAADAGTLDVFAAGDTDNAVIIVVDENGNPMPEGSTITITSSNDSILILSDTSYAVGNSNLNIADGIAFGATAFDLEVQNDPDGDAAAISTIKVKVTSPKGTNISALITVDSTTP
ncbi:hypothetical protein BOW53_00095 [Solemya pervernicosa gill symbiont]|uniref:Big-1 domain-containing protein n=1 Tax=Solemya pervernicosa gill symbiont TaxID=642797 RepID=A0A1T2LB91_9GAMM|nr:hypothetical protein BOW53_00095 [Solemya pervernicosa gill symbiont]